MPRISMYDAKSEKLAVREYSFTVIFWPLLEFIGTGRRPRRPGKQGAPRVKNPVREQGYQVTVPLLPGLVSYGRTLAEAREMARDAIRCHLEGLRKAGEPIPDERYARTGKLRVALSA